VDLVIAVIGLLVVAAGLLDMFRTLLHPSGNGRLSSWVMRVVWWQSKLTGHRLRSASGTVAMMAVVLMWLVLQVLGCAIVYYPYVPDGFAYAFNIDHADYHYVAEALYLSLVTIATLGFGDVVGTGPWLRFAPALEAITGFALLTAALAWFSQVWPPMARRRSLAAELRALGRADVAAHLVDGTRWRRASPCGPWPGSSWRYAATSVSTRNSSTSRRPIRTPRWRPNSPTPSRCVTRLCSPRTRPSATPASISASPLRI